MSTENMPSQQGELFLWYSDTPGYLNSNNKVVYENPHVIYLGHINKISESFSKSTTITPLVTLGAINAFPLDGGTGRTYAFNGSRQQPIGWQASDDLINPSTQISGNLPAWNDDASWNAIAGNQYVWSCKKWIMELQKFIDRWQMKTDGCFLLFRPSSVNPYVRLGPNADDSSFYKNMIHGYLKSIEFTYNSDFNEHVTYYLTLTVGTCRSTPFVNTFVTPPYDDGESVSLTDSIIEMTNKEKDRWYPLGSLAGTVTYTSGNDSVTYTMDNAVDKYRIVGGPNQPFETISMTIPKTKLKKIMNNYVDIRPNSYLVEGLNLIHVNAVGADKTFVLSSVKSVGGRSGTIKIQGRNQAYKFKTSANQSDRIVGMPFEIIKSILYAGRYGPAYGTNNFKYLVRQEYVPTDTEPDQSKILVFKKGRSIWDVLQICAISMKSKLFFIGDRAYLVDFTIPFDDYDNDALYMTNLTDTELFRYTKDNATYIETVNGTVLAGEEEVALRVFPDILPNDPYRTFMSGRVVGNCSYENQGVDTVTQTVTVNCTSPDMRTTEGGISTEYNETVCVKYTDERAKRWNEKYGNPDEEYGVIFDIDDLLEGTGYDNLQYSQGTDFARNYIEYMLEPQQPVSFEIRENSGTEWKMLFPYLAQADSFWDESDDLGFISNESIYPDSSDPTVYPRVPQKFCLSSYEMNFPEMSTTYTWGVVNNIDLSGRLADRF